MKQAFTEEHLDTLRSLASLVPCQMCRIKGGDNIAPNGSCRHLVGLSPGEIVDRLGYAVNQAGTARDIVKAIREGSALSMSDLLEMWDEKERRAGLV